MPVTSCLQPPTADDAARPFESASGDHLETVNLGKTATSEPCSALFFGPSLDVDEYGPMREVDMSWKENKGISDGRHLTCG